MALVEGRRETLVQAQPAPQLRGEVLGYRGYRLALARPRRRLEVPCGVVNVVFGLEGTLRLVSAVDPGRAGSFTSLVSGMQTTATVGGHLGHLYGIEVALTPLAAYTVFAIPMAELAHRHVDLADLLGSPAEQLVGRLADCPDWTSRFALLDKVFTARLAVGPQCSPEVAWAWRELRRTAGRVPIEALASATGWSRRHLERGFREQVGLPPKSVAQVDRLQKALRLGDSGLSWAQVATAAGYHDQPHLDRTIKAMIGSTPSRLHSHRAVSCPGAPLDRVPGQVTSVVLPT